MILAILQARLASTRLPGKVLRPILGKPMLFYQIERVLRSKKIDQLVIATSTESRDAEIEALCKNIKIPCFRGSLEDVLDRFYQAALPYNPDYIVRLTGDCPLTDPLIMDNVIDFFIKGNYEYACNVIEPTFPDGLDIEVFKFSTLEQIWQEAVLPSQREHVTLYVNQHPERFKIGNYRGKEDLSNLRWTVDEPEDFELICQIYEALYPQNPSFSTADVLDLLKRNPSLLQINRHFPRNEGLQKSLEADQHLLGNIVMNVKKMVREPS